jgi:bifunctional non-homologous end joining protein LigD
MTEITLNNRITKGVFCKMMPTIKPMEPVLVSQPFDDPRYLYQIKWDGIRIITYLSSEGIELRTKNGRLRTAQYPELLTVKDCFAGKNAILDGEAIVLGRQGIPSFHRILQRDLRKRVTSEIMSANPVVYLVFDLLYLNNQFVTGLPLAERQKLLQKHLRPVGHIFLCQNYSCGEELFQIMEEKGMEGIVAKEKSGLYHCGEKNRTWQKIKCFRTMEAILGGVALKDGHISALLVGLKSGGEKQSLQYIGKVSSGLRQSDLQQLQRVMAIYGDNNDNKSPFAGNPRPEKGEKLIWLPPFLLVKIQYLELTEKGVLRNPVFLGIAESKSFA